MPAAGLKKGWEQCKRKGRTHRTGGHSTEDPGVPPKYGGQFISTVLSKSSL